MFGFGFGEFTPNRFRTAPRQHYASSMMGRAAVNCFARSQFRPSALSLRIWSSVQTEDSCFDPRPLLRCLSEFSAQIYPSQRSVSLSFSSLFFLSFSAALKSAQHRCRYCQYPLRCRRQVLPLPVRALWSTIHRHCSLSSLYPHSMPLLLTKVEGKCIKTVFPNMSDVARALSRPPTYPTKFFGSELGAQTSVDEKNDRYRVNRAHNATRLHELLDAFIDKLCSAGRARIPRRILFRDDHA